MLQGELEFLKRRNDNVGPFRNRGGKLCGVFVDALDDALFMIELVNRFLELLVEHRPIRDDDNGIENPFVFTAEQAAQAVGQPGDRIAFAAPGGMLNQVAPPVLGLRNVPTERADDIDLMIPGKERAFLFDDPVVDLGFLFLDMQKTPENFHPAFRGQRFEPKIVRPVAFRIRRVARSAFVSLVERQEHAFIAVQLRAKENIVRIDGEVDQSPFLVPE